MNALVIACGPDGLRCTFLSADRVLARTEIGGFSATSNTRPNNAAAMRQLSNLAFDASGPDFVAIRSPLGVPRTESVMRITDAVAAQIDSLIPSAPLHLPRVLAAIAEAAATWPNVPLFLVSDTAFFADLPAREHTYGLDPALAARFGERRTGYHGLLHEAACRFVRRALRGSGPDKIISICLEPKPEAAAVLNGRPVMVTGGATPLEGLPGETACGEIDPSLVLTLAEKLDCGPERINDILARESGLCGLVGRKAKLGDVLSRNEPAHRQAREVFRYRLLLACGAAVAAMSGLDALVFSGRYVEAARKTAPWLISRLQRAAGCGQRKPAWRLFTEPVEKIAAEQAAFLREPMDRRGGNPPVRGELSTRGGSDANI